VPPRRSVVPSRLGVLHWLDRAHGMRTWHVHVEPRRVCMR
jgi:hypothetical protein